MVGRRSEALRQPIGIFPVRITPEQCQVTMMHGKQQQIRPHLSSKLLLMSEVSNEVAL